MALKCLPPCGGSGLKCQMFTKFHIIVCLPPCGGSGLKFAVGDHLLELVASPSVWREWIEMKKNGWILQGKAGLPPCGGSGLKFWNSGKRSVSPVCLPPCGGSGLK